MVNKYVFLAPYGEMIERAKEVASELNMKGWIFDIGFGDDGLAKAREYASQGVKIILSRNLTAVAIANNLDVPVIDLSASPYDILNGLVLARQLGKHIGVIGPESMVYGSNLFGPAMNLLISEIPIRNLSQLPTAIDDAKRSGVEVILGGQNEIRCAEMNGLKGVLIHTSKATIAATMEKAVDFCNIQYSQKLHSQQINTILDHSYEGIIGTDEKGKVILINHSAQVLLNSDFNVGDNIGIRQLIPNVSEDLLHPSSEDYPSGELYEVGNSLIMIHSRPVIVDGRIAGTVMTLQHSDDVSEIRKVGKEASAKGLVATVCFKDISTKSTCMEIMINQARHYALTDSTVLITGETGTGKEMVAQGIHNASSRKEGPFVAINCAAIPDTILESELFGYEDGSFTGARKNGKKGYFELADKGTIFLDEIGDIPLHLQSKLLRAIQQKQIMRVGGDKVISVDVRIIAATQLDLSKAMSEGKFREDLFYRLNVLRIMVPPLRNRPLDIPVLIHSISKKKSAKFNLSPISFSKKAMDILTGYAWPGNVRELENAVERLCIICEGKEVSDESLEEVLADYQIPQNRKTDAFVNQTFNSQKEILLDALNSSNWRKNETAKILGISTTTLWRRIKKYGINLSKVK